MSFELFIAVRYLRARRGSGVIGLVTAISVIGVAAGVAALILALAITNGMQRDLQTRLVGATAHVEILRSAGDGIRNWRPIVDKLARQPHVTAVAPGLYGQVLISHGPRAGGALIKGIVPEDEQKIGNLMDSVTVGSAEVLSSSGPLALSPGPSSVPPIVIGADLATTLGATVGDMVLVTSPQGELTPLGLIPRYQRFRIVGVFSSGFYQYDSAYAMLRLTDAQQLFSEPDIISVISIKVDDLNRADTIGRDLAQAAGPGFSSTSWMEQNRELFRALKLEQTVSFIVLMLIVIVAALNILIALTMMVMEKRRDIAVMMGFGVAARQIRRIFLLEGLLISAAGTVVGLIVGVAASFAGQHWHFIRLDASVYSMSTLPFAPRLLDALLVTALSLGVALLATLWPSRAAASILPAEALRYE